MKFKPLYFPVIEHVDDSLRRDKEVNTRAINLLNDILNNKVNIPFDKCITAENYLIDLIESIVDEINKDLSDKIYSVDITGGYISIIKTYYNYCEEITDELLSSKIVAQMFKEEEANAIMLERKNSKLKYNLCAGDDF